MRILAIDAAAKHLSAALVLPGSVVAEVTTAFEETHSRHLMALIHTLLRNAGWMLSILDGVAVTHGPGSFTGLRIAMSTVKGLSVAIGKPVASVSSLDALAFQSPKTETWITPMLDARKNEVYFTRFRVENGKLLREEAASAGPLEAALSGVVGPCLFIGEGALRYRDAIRRHLGAWAHFPEEAFHAIRASSVGFLGLSAFENGEGKDPGRVFLRYLRSVDIRKPETSLFQ